MSVHLSSSSRSCFTNVRSELSSKIDTGNTIITVSVSSRSSLTQRVEFELCSKVSVGRTIRISAHSRSSFKREMGVIRCHSRSTITDAYVGWVMTKNVQDVGYNPANTPPVVSYRGGGPMLSNNPSTASPTPTQGAVTPFVGVSITFPEWGTDDITTGFSYSKNFNGSVQWSCVMNDLVDINFAENIRCRLRFNFCGHEYMSPPLIASIRSTKEGIGVGRTTNANGTDYTSWILSKKTIDQPSFLGMYSDELLRQILNPTQLSVQQNNLLMQQLAQMILSGPFNQTQQQEYDAMVTQAQLADQITGIQIVNPPHYYIPAYSNYRGNMLDAITKILHDGGMGYYIDSNGDISCVGLMETRGTMGNTFIKTIEETYNANEKITQLQIIKQSPVQTHYEFVWTDTGFKNDIKFNIPMRSVTCFDRSVVGYLDLIALFDSPNSQTAGLVGIIVCHPLEHIGEHYAPVNSSNPIQSATLVVYPPKKSMVPGQKIYAKLVVEGIPYVVSGGVTIDYAFRVVYNTGESPALLSNEWVDGTFMPNVAHAEAIKESLFFDKTKKQHTITADMTDIYPFIEPANLFTFPGYPDSRVETVNISGGGVSFTACVLPEDV